MGAAPRYFGTKEKWMFTSPNRGSLKTGGRDQVAVRHNDAHVGFLTKGFFQGEPGQLFRLLNRETEGQRGPLDFRGMTACNLAPPAGPGN
jgi:hypothetical protein